MLAARVIVALTMIDDGLYRTRKFKAPSYVGDPQNAVRIFNDKEVDELLLLDISPVHRITSERLGYYSTIVSQAFMPSAFGGAISSLDEIDRLFRSGFDKVVLNSVAVTKPNLIEEAAKKYGCQSIAVSVDYRRTLMGKKRVVVDLGRNVTGFEPVQHAMQCEKRGAGEIIIRSIDHDGLMSGYDLDILSKVADTVSVPVVAAGGAGNLSHFSDALAAGAQSVCGGSMFVYHGKHRAVLITYPDSDELDSTLRRRWD